MNRIASLLILLGCLGCFAAQADAPPQIAQTTPVTPIDAPGELALHGYDAVSYFTSGKPEEGSAKYEYTWKDARWRFASAAHLSSFKADPGHYAPQFGGYCAFAVSLGRIADGDPNQWAIVDDKLFLNNNPKAKALWDQDRPGNITSGTRNWPLIPKQATVSP